MPQEKDRLRLRELANRQLEYAHSPRNDEILKQWQALSQGRRESPTVRLLFSNFTDEVIDPRMQCEGKEARELEKEAKKFAEQEADKETVVKETQENVDNIKGIIDEQQE